MMTRVREIVLGNLRLGDSFWALRDCLPETENHVYCIPYNQPAVEAAQELTTLRIDRVTVVRAAKAAQPERRGPGDYGAWIRDFYKPTLGAYPCIYRWTRRRGGQYGDCRPYPLRRPLVPAGYIVAQLRSHLSPWKRCAAIEPALKHVGAPVMRAEEADRSYADVGHALCGAEAFVGIPSSIAALAMLLGVPSVICWWTVPPMVLNGHPEWHTTPSHIRELVCPTPEQILTALADVRQATAAERRCA